MPIYAFVGSYAERLGKQFPLVLDKFGEPFEVPEEVSIDLCHQGVPHLPADTFGDLEFTHEELSKYPNRRSQQNAPDSVKAKIAQALKAWHDFRAASVAEQVPAATRPAELTSEGE